MHTRRRALLGVAIAGLAGCGAPHGVARSQTHAAQLVARGAAFTTRRAMPPSGTERNAPLARWILPHALREISGLALTADGRLLAHGDERGHVYVIDPQRGEVLAHFDVGESGTHADFEGITVADSTIYLLASNGTLYAFEEGAQGASVPYTAYDTRLGHECEFEGVAWERASESLLLACKVVKTAHLRDQLVIYRWQLGHSERPRLSTLTVPLSLVIGSNPWTTLHPSDITVDPSTGDYVLIASRERALVEITPAGDVVRSLPLPGEHEAAEGVALTRDSILIISDEARTRPAQITLYHWPPSAIARPTP
jgi:SdiA-regulated